MKAWVIKVTVSALFNGDTSSLQQVLYALESQISLLFVEQSKNNT